MGSSRRAQKAPGRLQEALGKPQELSGGEPEGVSSRVRKGTGGRVVPGAVILGPPNTEKLNTEKPGTQCTEHRKSTNPQTRPARRSAVADIRLGAEPPANSTKAVYARQVAKAKQNTRGNLTYQKKLNQIRHFSSISFMLAVALLALPAC